MRAYLRLNNPILRELEATLPQREKSERWADHIGVDEAGRGCLAGPVVAAAVLFPVGMDFKKELPGLADSKKLSEKQREALTDPIHAKCIACGVGIIWQDEIDRINILCATFRAMARAVLALYASLEEKLGPNQLLPALYIDGNRIIPHEHWSACCAGISPAALAWEQYLPHLHTRLPVHTPDLPPQKAVVDGDEAVPSISAASILAKTTRDDIMRRMEFFFPGYSFEQHKGYGTREHRDILETKGPCRLHRSTFRLIRSVPGAAQLPLPEE